jgi:excisionase family DNA binding protein
MKELPNRPTLRVSEVAEYYGVSERTVYNWISKRKLDVVFTPGGQKRITLESLNDRRYASDV